MATLFGLMWVGICIVISGALIGMGCETIVRAINNKRLR